MLTQQMLDVLTHTVEKAGLRQQPIHIHISITCGAYNMVNTSGMIPETRAQYTRQIMEVQQRIEQVREALHTYRDRVCAAIVEYLPNELERLCQQAWETKIREEAIETCSQASDAAFVRDMNQSIYEAVDTAKKQLQNMTYWVYLNPLPETFWHDHGTRKILYETAREQIKRLLQELFGYAGSVIVKHKCITGNTPQWHLRGTAHPHYDSIISLGHVRKPLGDYEKAMGEYLQLHLNRYQLTREQKNIEVNTRWEQAKAAC